MSANSTVWNEAKPSINDLVSTFPSNVTQNVVAFRQGIEQHFEWRGHSGLSAGQPSLQSAPGGARAYFALASQHSALDSGRLFIASDTKELWSLSSLGDTPIGSVAAVSGFPTRVVAGQPSSWSTMGAGTQWLVQSGFSNTPTSPVSFPIAYSDVAPLVFLTVLTNDASVNGFSLAVTASTKTNFSFAKATLGSGSSFGLFWMSEGTTVLS